MKIMVVDDDPISRKILSEILSDLGVCHQFDRGTDALAAFDKAIYENQPYHLITLDISMPDIDGITVLNHFRTKEAEFKITKEKKSKVVMITSHDSKDALLSAISEDCTDYIIKPFNKKYILKRFAKLGIIDDF